MDWTSYPPCEQKPLPGTPYDRWVAPGGHCMAEFRRDDRGILIRFPGQADFLIGLVENATSPRISCWPVNDCPQQTVTNLFHNAISPLLGNYSGGLFLHGSAVRIDRTGAEIGAVAFLGHSRGGKTTLAGSFSKEGFPFLTEDVIDLDNCDGRYLLQPKRSKLRLFADSARHLLGEGTEFSDEDRKQDVEAGDGLVFADRPAPLRQIYILGTDHEAQLGIRRLNPQEALAGLMPHAFILDVEDKPRLRDHFSRLADLSQDIGCYALDYRRDYAELPKVKRAVLENFGQDRAGS